MRIQYKLFGAFLFAGISLVALMFVLMQWSLSKGLIEFVNTKERDAIAPLIKEIERRYDRRGDWRWIDGRHRMLFELFREYTSPLDGQEFERRPPPHRPPRHERPERGGVKADERRPPPRHRPPPRGRRGPPNVSLLNQDRVFIAGNDRYSEEDHWLAIKSQQQVVGWLVIPRRHGLAKGYELTLLEQQRFDFLLISLCISLFMIVISMPLARHLIRPIKQLAAGMEQLRKGNYNQRIELKRDDELGNLGRDVNELAVTLEENDTARKRWLANISHELRTPIAVLKSEMEAVQDGIRPLDHEHVNSTFQEVQRLQRLVEDLYELTSADIGGMKYRKEEFDIVEFIQEEIEQFELLLTQANIQLNHHLLDSELIVWGDCDRLSQLFNNLMVNCAKYAKADGQVNLSLQSKVDRVIITIEDDGEGVPQQHLANLFEHLYRVDDSRNRNTGGSGLGLAICKQIVEAHHGKIFAEKSSLGGLAVIVELPLVVS